MKQDVRILLVGERKSAALSTVAIVANSAHKFIPLCNDSV